VPPPPPGPCPCGAVLLEHLDLALIRLVPLLEVLLVVHGQQRLGIGILGSFSPTLHLPDHMDHQLPGHLRLALALRRPHTHAHGHQP
jgi:hypothetical protein